VCAAEPGSLEAMRLLLDHPSADPEAMMALRNTDGASAFVVAAEIAAGMFTVPPSCKPLLLLLRRVSQWTHSRPMRSRRT
jgi:hypothetical protein